MKTSIKISELKEKRARLARIQWHEYTTRGNTQRCQELFAEIEQIDAEIESLTKK